MPLDFEGRQAPERGCRKGLLVPNFITHLSATRDQISNHIIFELGTADFYFAHFQSFMIHIQPLVDCGQMTKAKIQHDKSSAGVDLDHLSR